MIVVVILGVVACLAISPMLGDMAQHEAKAGIFMAQQAILTGKSTASRLSQSITVDFSASGVIRIKESDGTVLNTYTLEENVLYDSGHSTLVGRKVIFNFRGEPVDVTGSTAGFTTANNTVAVSCNDASYTLQINPVTGSVDVND